MPFSHLVRERSLLQTLLLQTDPPLIRHPIWDVRFQTPSSSSDSFGRVKVSFDGMLSVLATRDQCGPRIPKQLHLQVRGRPLLHYHAIRSRSWRDLDHEGFSMTGVLVRSGVFLCSGVLALLGVMDQSEDSTPIRIWQLTASGSGKLFCDIFACLERMGSFRNKGPLPIRYSTGFQWF